MGDRGNIVVKQAAGPIWLYSHSGGSRLPQQLQRALQKNRTDEAYLTRIIFCEMVKGFEEDVLGFGISSYLQDNSHDFLVVDPSEQTVSVVAASYSGATEDPLAGAVRGRWSFEAFCKLDIADRTYPENLAVP